MQAELMNCPHCNTPLRVQPGQTLALCLYCNASRRIYYPASSKTQVCCDRAVSPDTIDQVKQLLFAGRRPEAIALYQQKTGADTAAAADAVESFVRQISLDVVFSQALSPAGILWVMGLLAVGAGVVAAALAGLLP